jgi:predicted AAA+ superfamily ATPase
MWFQREISDQLKQAAQTRPALVLTGPRQVGKSSLLRALFPHHRYVTLDSIPEASLAEQNPKAFLESHPAPLIIDEIQYAPGLLRHLKVAIDEDRKQYGRYLLSGSQSFELMRGVSESLAGRVAVFQLEGLTRSELRSAPSTPGVWEQIWKGGFPELWASPKISVPSFHQSYIATYLERDVRNLLKVGNLRDFDRFIRACALRSAQILNKSDLARDVGISPSTAGEWLSVLEASRQVFLLEPWFSNKTKSLIKSPKLYFGDTGLLCSLLRITAPERIREHVHAGAIWETHVFSELRRTLANRAEAGRLNFWSDRRREVDFVFEKDGSIHAWDAKLHELPADSDTAQLRHFREVLPRAARESTVLGLITPSEKSFPLSSGIEVLGSDLAWI